MLLRIWMNSTRKFRQSGLSSTLALSYRDSFSPEKTRGSRCRMGATQLLITDLITKFV